MHFQKQYVQIFAIWNQSYSYQPVWLVHRVAKRYSYIIISFRSWYRFLSIISKCFTLYHHIPIISSYERNWNTFELISRLSISYKTIIPLGHTKGKKFTYNIYNFCWMRKILLVTGTYLKSQKSSVSLNDRVYFIRNLITRTKFIFHGMNVDFVLSNLIEKD